MMERQNRYNDVCGRARKFLSTNLRALRTSCRGTSSPLVFTQPGLMRSDENSTGFIERTRGFIVA